MFFDCKSCVIATPVEGSYKCPDTNRLGGKQWAELTDEDLTIIPCSSDITTTLATYTTNTSGSTVKLIKLSTAVFLHSKNNLIPNITSYILTSSFCAPVTSRRGIN